MSKENITFKDYGPDQGDLYHDVIMGLSSTPRMIPPKYFYDKKGSKLFDLITQTPEYYPTKTENMILANYAPEITDKLTKECILIEPGGGSCSKVLGFIDQLQPQMYVPIDISKDHLMAAAKKLKRKLPWLDILAICHDFTEQITVPDEVPEKSRVVFFPGSSIGNFHPQDAAKYLSSIARLAGIGGQLLIGVDLKKDRAVLERAYDDSQGITSQFNLNILTRINNELNAGFDLQAWQHYAFYNSLKGRIEMHLKSLCEQVVEIQDHEFYFSEGETIHTENSYKYTVDEFIALSSDAGFASRYVWTDDDKLFSVHLFDVAQG